MIKNILKTLLFMILAIVIAAVMVVSIVFKQLDNLLFRIFYGKDV